MTTPDVLSVLATNLRDFAPKLRSIDGRSRLILDILAGEDHAEALEVFPQPDHDPFLVLQSVHVDAAGCTSKLVVAVVYGHTLVPGLVRDYRDMRHEQVLRMRQEASER